MRIPARVRTLFHGPLVEWYRENRRDLPWRRRQDDPYAVWISEVMLQQTQVATAGPYFERWMERFPTVRSLAEADEQEVLRYWSGLGYYARARNLHRAASHLVERFNGDVPADVARLRTVPGIGPYTAGAIVALAHDRPAVVVDTNVTRVLARVFVIAEEVLSAAGQRRIRNIAERLTPAANVRDYTQAMMELGATLCTAKRPNCAGCPLRTECRAAASGDPENWPRMSARREVVRQVHAAAVIVRQGGVLLGLRPSQGRWGGLWELPTSICAEGEPTDLAAVRAAAELVGLAGRPSREMAAIRHTVTHHAVRLVAHEVEADDGDPVSTVYERLEWAPLDGIHALPQSSPQARLIAAIAAARLRAGADSTGAA